MPHSARRLTGALLAAVAITASPVAATVRTDAIKFRWAEPPATAARKDIPFTGSLELVAGRAGVATALVVDAPGWKSCRLDAPAAIVFAKGGRRTLGITGVPGDDGAAITVRGLFDGQPFERRLALDQGTLDKGRRPGSVRFEDGVRTSRADQGARAGGQVIRFRGQFVYTRGDGVVLGADSLIVRIRDDDSPDPFDDTIWEGVTDRNGYFDVTVDWDDCDITGCDDPDIYVEFTTAGGLVDVQRDDLLESTYLWSSEDQVIDDYTGSDVNFGTMRSADGAEDGAVHVWNGVLRAQRYALQIGGILPPLVDVLWPSDAATSYSSTHEEISIRADRTWNEISHAHEFMHHVEHHLGHLDPPNYGSGGHFLWCTGSSSDGWQEGVANWFGRRVAEQQLPFYNVLAWAAGVDGMGNLNDSRYGTDGLGTCNGTPNPGAGTEGYVMALLRDIEDPNPAVDDHDGATPCERDAMALGDPQIFTIIREHGPETILDFIASFRLRFPEHDQDFWSTVRNTDPAWGFPLTTPVVTSLSPSGCRVVRAGETVEMRVVGNGALLTYQWRQNGANLANSSSIQGATSATLRISPVGVGSSGAYSCRVTSCDGTLSAISVPEQLSVEAAQAASPLVSWGENFGAQIGDGTIQGPRPARVHTGLTNVVDVDGGRSFTVAVLGDGTVRSWGSAQWGELGSGNTFDQRLSPGPVGVLSDVIRVAAGRIHALALRRDGTVSAWGYNGYGQLGDGTVISRNAPVPATAISGCVRAIACGDHHSLVLLADGSVLAWGANEFGALGRGTSGGWSTTPLPVSGLANIIAISAESYGNLALRSDGTVWAWGWNNSGQLGDGTTTHRSTPVQVVGPSNIRAITMGYFNGYALDHGGATWAWGANPLIGDGNLGGPFPRPPAPVATLAGAVEIGSTEGDWSMGRWPDGTLRAWGSNYNEVFGAPASNSYVPVTVAGPSSITAMRVTWGTGHALGTVSGIVSAPGSAPAALTLGATPNPAPAAVQVAFELPAGAHVKLDVFDLAGRHVRSLVDAVHDAGRHSVHWDGRATGGTRVGAGVYYVQLESMGQSRTQRIVRLR